MAGCDTGTQIGIDCIKRLHSAKIGSILERNGANDVEVALCQGASLVEAEGPMRNPKLSRSKTGYFSQKYT